MIKVYFKQAWELIRQNKLYSTVYIIGTGLSIAMIMTIAIIYYVKIAPYYPETNRNRMLSFKTLTLRYEKGGMSSSSLSYSFVREHLYSLKSAECTSAVLTTYGETDYVEQQETRKLIPVTIKYTDTNFWKVFGFEFLNGKPYSEQEFQSAIHTVVISAGLAKKTFGTTEVEGRRIIINSDEYRISGVVRDASYVTPLVYANIFMPFTLRAEEIAEVYGEGYLGPLSTYILAPSASAKENVKQEIFSIIDKLNNSQEKYKIDLTGQPDDYWKTYFRKFSNIEIDWWDVFSTFGIMLFALLFVPAINLAGMVSSRMEKRLPEMGVRKAFGASGGTLINQVLVENFVLTILGGLVGLIISWLIVYASRYWIFTLFDSWPQLPPDGVDSLLPAGVLFSPGIFVIGLAVCLLLNLISAILPAWSALKKNIVYSLDEKN